MEARPPALIAAIVSRLIPPASREPVLGDLHERYQGPWPYVREAAAVLPHVIWSRLKRTFDPTLVVTELQVVWLALVTNPAHSSPVAAATPAVVILAVLTLCDVYGRSGKELLTTPDALDDELRASLLQAGRDVALAIVLAWVAEAILRRIDVRLALPRRTLVDLSGASLLMLGALRTAWWTMFSKGSRLMRTAVAIPPNGLSPAEMGERTWWLHQVHIGQAAWVFIAIGLIRIGWVQLVLAPYSSRVAGLLMIAGGTFVGGRSVSAALTRIRLDRRPGSLAEYRHQIERCRDLLNGAITWNTSVVVMACLAGTVLANWNARSSAASTALVMLMATSLAGIQRRVSLKLYDELESIDRQA